MDNSIKQKEAKERLELLQSMDVAADKRTQLKQLFPEVFSEDKVDFEQLKRVLGDWIEPSKERFGLTWPGKAECMRVIQEPSIATLKPAREESIDFDTTENLFIEGDNLEVLKLLQKSYYGKVKLIYIDPPYNTGKEFIYPDKYSETLETYLQYTGQIDSEGRRFSTNTEAEGRFHSRWLSMMYPRLYLAKNLLREDGAIFISISDHEVAALKHLLNEIFGEENFGAQFIWKSRKYPDSRAKTGVSTDHEYILFYTRSDLSALRGVERDETKFSNPDNDPRGVWMSRSLLGLATKAQRPNLHYEIVDPVSRQKFMPPEETGWRYAQDRMQSLIEAGCVLFPTKEDGRPREKKFRADLQNEYVAFPSIINDVHTSDGTGEIRLLFEREAFDFAKPSELLRRLIKQATEKGDIILDFFAGSATTAHAVMELNKQDSGKRKFILVQLPEPTGREDYRTIADISKERIRRAGAKIAREKDGKLDLGGNAQLDLGFKVFKLDRSNFRIWDGKVGSDEELVEQLELHVDHLNKQSSTEDILYELLLKAGFPLTTPIKNITRAQRPVYSVAEGEMLICLEKELTAELIDSIAELEPSRVVFLDEGFKGNDQLKANAVQSFKSRATNREREIVFRTM